MELVLLAATLMLALALAATEVVGTILEKYWSNSNDKVIARLKHPQKCRAQVS